MPWSGFSTRMTQHVPSLPISVAPADINSRRISTRSTNGGDSKCGYSRSDQLCGSRQTMACQVRRCIFILSKHAGNSHKRCWKRDLCSGETWTAYAVEKISMIIVASSALGPRIRWKLSINEEESWVSRGYDVAQERGTVDGQILMVLKQRLECFRAIKWDLKHR